MNLKNNYLFKKLLKRANKKCKNFNFYNIVFKKKIKEKHLEISLFYTCLSKMMMISSTIPETDCVKDWNW